MLTYFLGLTHFSLSGLKNPSLLTGPRLKEKVALLIRYADNGQLLKAGLGDSLVFPPCDWV